MRLQRRSKVTKCTHIPKGTTLRKVEIAKTRDLVQISHQFLLTGAFGGKKNTKKEHKNDPMKQEMYRL